MTGLASVSSASLHVIVVTVTEHCDGARKRALAQAPRQDATGKRVARLSAALCFSWEFPSLSLCRARIYRVSS